MVQCYWQVFFECVNNLNLSIKLLLDPGNSFITLTQEGFASFVWNFQPFDSLHQQIEYACCHGDGSVDMRS